VISATDGYILELAVSVISEIIDWIFGKHVRNKLHASYFYGRALAESNAHTYT
jgi:hypothetical protein